MAIYMAFNKSNTIDQRILDNKLPYNTSQVGVQGGINWDFDASKTANGGTTVNALYIKLNDQSVDMKDGNLQIADKKTGNTYHVRMNEKPMVVGYNKDGELLKDIDRSQVMDTLNKARAIAGLPLTHALNQKGFPHSASAVAEVGNKLRHAIEELGHTAPHAQQTAAATTHRSSHSPLKAGTAAMVVASLSNNGPSFGGGKKKGPDEIPITRPQTHGMHGMA